MPVVVGLILIVVAIYAVLAGIAFALALVAGIFVGIAFATDGVTATMGLGPVAGWFLLWSVVACSCAAVFLNTKLRKDLPSVSFAKVQEVVNRTKLHFLLVTSAAIACVIGLYFS